MGRLLGWLIGVPFAAAAATFAAANRTPVAADLWPLPWTVEAPLYLFVLLALLVGFLAGAGVAWASSFAAKRRIRAQARAEIDAARKDAAGRALQSLPNP
ncbi:MAG: DUF1049 domain-containing protein [Rhodospirillales bacterium]|nr:DUF1049 domain-containing protein [Rhodospirillales bacterium]